MTSAGRLLSGTVKGKDGLGAALEEVLEQYARLPEPERRPKTVAGEVQPQPAPPAGGLVLTIHDRLLGRDDKGEYRLPTADDFAGLRTEAPHGQRSSLWLTREECKSLLPENPQQGQTHKVPSKLARRVFLYGLVPQSFWVVEETWKPNSVLSGELNVTVEKVTPNAIHLRVHGSVLLSGPGVLHTWPDHKFIKNVENRYEARLEGVIVFNQADQGIAQWDMVALGDFSGRWFAGNKGWQEATAAAPLPLGFAFAVDQTASTLPPEQRRPRSFMHAYIFRDHEAHYWDPDLWLKDWQRKQQK
jgi:hypothetical protein